MSADTNNTDIVDLSLKVGLSILGVVLFFSFFIFSGAVSFESPKPSANRLAMLEAAALERIRPVGQVRTSLAGAESQASEQAAATPKTGEELVNGVCASCHATGLLNAPKIGVSEDWVARNEKGLDGLVESAINGLGNMPPRGGSSLSDEEIRLAVKYMSGL